MLRRLSFVLAITLSLLYPARSAFANGRFPEAQQLAIVPNGADPSLLVLRTSFGIVLSHDAGKTWSWVCERALGFDGTWDPPIAVTKDGRIWVGLVDGLRITRDGCGTSEVKALHGARITDLAVDARGENVLALSSPIDAPATVWIVHADGKADALPGDFKGLELKTADFAPSSGKIWVTAAPFQQANSPRAHLFVGSATKPFVEVPLPVAPDEIVYLSAVDPKNDQRLVARALSARGTNVIVSNDGGKTFTTALHVGTLLFGFAKSDDGKTMFTGSGDPNDGIWESEDRGTTWKQASKTSVRCLTLAGDVLYACSTPYRPNGFAVGASRDQGLTFATLSSFKDIAGPIACDAGEGLACRDAWPAQKSVLDPKPAAAVDAGALAVGDAASGDGGSRPAERGKSCGCRAAGAPTPVGPESLLLLGLTLYLIVRVDRR